MSIQIPTIQLVNNQQIILTEPVGMDISKIGWITFLNESPFLITLNAGGLNIPIGSWDDYPIQVNKLVNGVWTRQYNIIDPISITPSLLSANLITNLSTSLVVTFFGLGETPPSTVPRSLNRQSYVPNVVSNVSGTATNLVNDGNPGGQNIIESTPFGGTKSTVSVDNDGNAFLEGTLEVHTGAIINAITTEASNDLALNILNGQNLFVVVGSTGRVFDVNASGIKLIAGTMAFLAGSIARVGTFSGTSVIGHVTVTHNLGVVPDNGYVQFQINSAPSAHIIGIDLTGATSTQINVWSDIAGVNFFGMLYKF